MGVELYKEQGRELYWSRTIQGAREGIVLE